eukprot:scaffold32943_cov101-Isochrysis_galbana.AAC.1
MVTAPVGCGPHRTRADYTLCQPAIRCIRTCVGVGCEAASQPALARQSEAAAGLELRLQLPSTLSGGSGNRSLAEASPSPYQSSR